MDKIMQYPSIPRSLLAFLLDQAGEPGEMSPRHLWPDSTMPNPRQAQELFDAEIFANPTAQSSLSPRFSRIAQTLLNPQTNLTFRVWGNHDAAVETNIQFPGFIRDGNGVALNQLDGAFQIGAFVDDNHILEQLAPVLSVVPEAREVVDFEAHLPLSVTATLFALLDLYRGLEYPAPPYSSVAINGYIQGKWGLTGLDDLLNYLLGLGYPPVPPSQVEVEVALEMLTNLAFLEEVEEGYYELGVELLPLVDLTRGDLPGLQWQRILNDESGDLLTANRIWLYGNDGFILMLAPTGDHRVFVSSVNVKEMKEFVVAELLGPIPVSSQDLHSPQKAETVKNGHACVECGGELPANTTFCVSCGAPVVAEKVEEKAVEEHQQKFCTACGAELPANAKFCTGCGAKI